VVSGASDTISIERVVALGVAVGYMYVSGPLAGATGILWSGGGPVDGTVTATYQTSGQVAEVEFDSSGNYTPVGNDIAIRGRARSVAMKVSSSSSSIQWRLGDMRIDVQPDGRR